MKKENIKISSNENKTDLAEVLVFMNTCENTSNRRIKLNIFYFSIISFATILSLSLLFIFPISAMLSAIFGISISFLAIRNNKYHNKLNESNFEALKIQLESLNIVSSYHLQYDIYSKGKNKVRITKIEYYVWLFLVTLLVIITSISIWQTLLIF